MEKVAFTAIDVHARHCVIGWMDSGGKYRSEDRVPTSESALIHAVVRIEARRRIVVIEEGSLALWVARTLRPYADELIVCDPKENHLISKNVHKGDGVDTYALCRLARLGELKCVYQAADDHRAVFKEAAQEYTKLRDRQRTFKQRIKAKYRRWGVHAVDGYRLYHVHGRTQCLKQLSQAGIRRQLERLYSLMDLAVAEQDDAWQHLQQLGQRYDEIQQFVKMPGMGPKGSHLFDAIIQTPHRFSNKRKVWRYCGLGVISRTSDGKPLGYKRLDRSGHGELKAVSFRAVQAARRAREDNEVKAFYAASLDRTQDRTKARLNTQRKIIGVLYSIWKRRVAYNPDLFLKTSPSRRVAA